MVLGLNKKPPKKTYEQVFADLVKALSEKADKSLSHVRDSIPFSFCVLKQRIPQPISLPSQPTLSDLEVIFRQITCDSFANKFQYQFNSQSTAPPSLAPGTRVISTFEHFYKVEDANKSNAPPLGGTSSNKNGSTDPPFTPIPDDRQRMSGLRASINNTLNCGFFFSPFGHPC